MLSKTEIEIYYFSGTGNTLFVVKELQKRLPNTKLIPIVSILNKKVIKTTNEIIGFIFPTYLLTMPVPVKNFIEKLDLSSAKYIFAIGTRGGAETRAFQHINSILKKKGKTPSAFKAEKPQASPTLIYTKSATPPSRKISKII